MHATLEENEDVGVRWKVPADVLRVMTPLDPWGRVVLDPSFELERLRHGAVLTYFMLTKPSATESELTAAYNYKQKRQGMHGSVGAHEQDLEAIPQLLHVDVDGLDEWTTDEEDSDKDDDGDDESKHEGGGEDDGGVNGPGGRDGGAGAAASDGMPARGAARRASRAASRASSAAEEPRMPRGSQHGANGHSPGLRHAPPPHPHPDGPPS